MARKSRVVSQTETAFEERAYSWNIAIYTRLSVEDGDDTEHNSIANQKKLCMSYLPVITDGMLTKVYSDNGYSGMNYERPGFQEMYDAIISGEVNCVLVKDVSRFGRNYIITSEYLQRTLPNMGIRFISVNDNYDSINPDADSEGLLLPFKMIVNDSYVKDISKKIRSSIGAKMNAGEYLPSSSSVPYGYIRNPKNNTFDIDYEVAHIIQRIFKMRSESMTYNAIACVLNKEGILSPGRLRFERGLTQSEKFKKAEWDHKTVRRILSESVYIGNRIHGKVKRERLGADKKWQREEDWQVHSNMHEAIISEELFNIVQDINKNESEKRKALYTPRKQCYLDTRDLFRDKMFCGDCGARMVGNKRNQRVNSNLPSTIYFQCYEYKHSNRVRCVSHYMPQEKIMSAVTNIMNSQVAILSDVESLLKVNVNKTNSEIQEMNWLKSIRVRRKNIESKIERLLVDLTSGVIDKAEYEFAKSKYIHLLKELQNDEQDAVMALEGIKERMETANRWLESVKTYKKVPEITKDLIDIIINKIFVFSDGRIHIELNYENPYLDFQAEQNDGVKNYG